MRDEALDVAHQVANAAERPAPNGSLGDEVEPDLDLIEPRSAGGGEVKVVARPRGEPTLNASVLVSAVVVQDQVDLEPEGDVRVDLAKEVEELLMAVMPPTLGQHLTGSDVERGEQRGGAVPHIVVGNAFHIAEPDRQQGLGAFPRAAWSAASCATIRRRVRPPPIVGHRGAVRRRVRRFPAPDNVGASDPPTAATSPTPPRSGYCSSPRRRAGPPGRASPWDAAHCASE